MQVIEFTVRMPDDAEMNVQSLFPQIYILLALVLSLVSFPFKIFAQTVLDLTAKTTIIVYESPDRQSKQVTRLEPGDKVVISPASYGNFRKVLLRFVPKVEEGYIASDDADKSTIIERGAEISSARHSHRHLISIGASASFFSHRLGLLEFRTSTNQDYSIDRFSGQGLVPTIIAEFPFLKDWKVRGHLGSSTRRFEGTAKPKSGTGQEATITATEDETFFGATIKYYELFGRDWWLGLGFEFVMASSFSLEAKNTVGIQIPVTFIEDAEPRSYTSLASGIDFQVAENWFISPEIRFNYALSGSPTYLGFGGGASLVYGF